MEPEHFTGIGLRYPHYEEILLTLPSSIGWLEVHTENFFHKNTQAYTLLRKIAEHYPISLHGVGLSLGSADELSARHLRQIKSVIEDIHPILLSEHLSWNRCEHNYLPDLIPIPYTEESLSIFCQHVMQTQEYLGQRILIENPSSYITYQHSEITEYDFLSEICRRTGAGLLLDVNNVFVSSMNHGWQAQHYINALSSHHIEEIHLAGHSTRSLSDGSIVYIDTHDTLVSEAVWDLYQYTCQRHGRKLTLIEWDDDIPELEALLSEAAKSVQYALIPNDYAFS